MYSSHLRIESAGRPLKAIRGSQSGRVNGDSDMTYLGSTHVFWYVGGGNKSPGRLWAFEDAIVVATYSSPSLGPAFAAAGYEKFEASLPDPATSSNDEISAEDLIALIENDKRENP